MSLIKRILRIAFRMFFRFQLEFTIPQGWCLNLNANLGSTTVTNHGEPVPNQIVFKIKTLLKVLNHPFLN